MYPVSILSLNDGWKILSEQNPEELNDIQYALSRINKDVIRNPDKFLDGIGQVSSSFNAEYVYASLESIFPMILKRRQWRQIARMGNIKFSSMKGGALKNKVIIYFASTVETAKDLEKVIYIDAPRNTIEKRCDVTIVVVPDKTLRSFSGKKSTVLRPDYISPFYEYECRKRLHKLQPIESSAPIVFLFCSTKERELKIAQLDSDKIPAVDRSLVFPPEFYQAGVTVLSNFGNILKQKYPNINARVRIEQDGNTVRMHVALPDGEVKVAEEVLDSYLKVVQEQKPPSALLDNPLQVAMLEQKLEMVKLELRGSANLYQLALRTNDTMRADHEQVIENFQRIIGEQSAQLERQDKQLKRKDKQLDRQADHIDSLVALSDKQTTVHGHVQMAQINHASTLFQDLLGEAQGSRAAVEAVETLQRLLMAGFATVEVEDQIKAALSTLKEEKPSLLNHLAGQLESAGFGALGGVALEWLGKHAV